LQMESKLDVGKLQEAYKHATKRLFFLDYDGTLVAIHHKPEDATPPRELLKLLSSLSADAHTRIYIISGRDRKFLTHWVGDLRIGLSAEHGAFLRPINNNGAEEWRDVIAGKNFDLRWKEEIAATFKKFCDEVPQSFIETKEYGITLHYRNSDKAVVKSHKPELRERIAKLTTTYKTLDVRKGKKTLEARVAGITKGFILKEILSTTEKQPADFVMCIGDDLTDEDMFCELAKQRELRNVFTCTVGKKAKSCSTAYVEKQTDVLETLHALTDIAHAP